MDAIVASGFEAGGHRGAFLGRHRRWPDRHDVAGSTGGGCGEGASEGGGGIADARGDEGRPGASSPESQIGTAFLASEESGANPLHRAALRGPGARDTGLTRGFSGRLARGIRNKLMDEAPIARGRRSFPIRCSAHSSRCSRSPPEQAGRPDLMPLWAGRSTELWTNPDAAAFLHSLIEKVTVAANIGH